MHLVHKLSWYKTSVSTAMVCHRQQTELKYTFGGTSGRPKVWKQMKGSKNV